MKRSRILSLALCLVLLVALTSYRAFAADVPDADTDADETGFSAVTEDPETPEITQEDTDENDADAETPAEEANTGDEEAEPPEGTQDAEQEAAEADKEQPQEEFPEVTDGSVPDTQLFDRIMACATAEELDALAEEVTPEELETLTEEQIGALEEHIGSIEPEPAPRIEQASDPVVSSEIDFDDTAAGSFTYVAPFGDPVVGTAGEGGV